MLRDVTDPSTDLVSVAHVAADGLMLSVLSGDAKGAEYPLPVGLGAIVRVGKAPDNDLVLPDSTVSRYHLTLTRTEAGLVVKDLQSTNGVKVGGAKVEQALLEPGATLKVGDTTVVLRVQLQRMEIPPSTSNRFGLAVGESLLMRRIFGMLERIASSPATVLLMGETGTGKDVLARSVHIKSARATGPFEIVDCGAIAENLIESELFGHERGSFTGAIATREGSFAMAQGGTLFLDEIGELPLSLQPKLLRVLEARQYRRVGGNKTYDTDVRIVAATARDLAKEVEAGRFREDLYFRLAVVPIYVPPLRERPEDLRLLAEAILNPTANGIRMSEEFVLAMQSYPWPGNVRELRNALERAVHLARASGDTELRSLPMQDVFPIEEIDMLRFEDGVSYRDARARFDAIFERRFVHWALLRHGGNIAAAARAVKMDRKYLGELVRKHGRP